MTQTLTDSRHQLFVKLRPTNIISDTGPLLFRYGGYRRKRTKLPPVTHGCSLTVGEVTGMKAIRAGMLLAMVNAQLAFVGDL
jgi:hypothetical protein